MMIKLDLTLDEVNIVLNALSNRPYIEVAELVGKIKTVGENQIKAETQTETMGGITDEFN